MLFHFFLASLANKIMVGFLQMFLQYILLYPLLENLTVEIQVENPSNSCVSKQPDNSQWAHILKGSGWWCMR